MRRPFLGPLPLTCPSQPALSPTAPSTELTFLLKKTALSLWPAQCLSQRAWGESQSPHLVWLRRAPLCRHPSLCHPGLWTFSQRCPGEGVDTDSPSADGREGPVLLREHLPLKDSVEAEKCGHESNKGHRNIQPAHLFLWMKVPPRAGGSPVATSLMSRVGRWDLLSQWDVGPMD